jgi:hypothetical protein
MRSFLFFSPACAAGTMTANRQVGLFYLGIVVVAAALLAMPFQAASQTICKPQTV